MNRRVASPPSMSSSSFLTAAVGVKKEEEEDDEVEPPTGMGLKKEEDDNGNDSVPCAVKQEEDEDSHQNITNDPNTIRSTTMVPDAAISSSSNSTNISYSGGTKNDNSTNIEHPFETWESGNWCWLDDHKKSNDRRHQKKEEEEHLNNGTNGCDNDTRVKKEEEEKSDNQRNDGDDDTEVKKEDTEDNDSSFDTKNSTTGDDTTRVKKEKVEDNGSGFDTNNSTTGDDGTEVNKEEENENSCTRTGATVSDNIIKGNNDYYDDWTTGNWCLEGRPHSTTTIGKRSAVRSAVAAAITSTVAVSTGIKNKRKLKQSRENHKKKPRTINQNNKNNNNNNINTNLDEDNNNNGLHDDGKDDHNGDDNDDDYDDCDDDDDDDYSDVNCDESNDDESEPDSVVVAETSMHNGGAIVRRKDDERWNKIYGRLLKYKKKYKSTSVPCKFKDDRRLGGWVHKQREMYKINKLSTARINRLNSINFVWNEYDAQWTDKYARLVAYKNRFKSTCVPQSYEADPQLALWVATQRKYYNTNNSSLTTERKDQLDSIGFVCDPFDAQWLEMYDRLVQYKKEHKTTCVPNSYPADRQLGRWVGKQRTDYKKKNPCLTTDRISKLNSVGFVWDPFDKRWTEMYDRLIEYKKQHKSTCVPTIYKDDPQLAQWVRTQRTSYNSNSSTLTADRMKLLNSIGFIWKTRKYDRNV